MKKKLTLVTGYQELKSIAKYLKAVGSSELAHIYQTEASTSESLELR